MKTIRICFNAATTPARAHRIIAGALDFPDYYGNNLDALYDCLTDLSGQTEIHFYGTEVLANNPAVENAAAFVRGLRETFRDAEEETGCIHAVWES